MFDFKVFSGGSPPQDIAAELSARIKDIVYEYDGKMPLATAIGVLDIVKQEILDEAE